eukprot:scaffold123139_cov45-Phaeocystis_antarctica.AAC.1
MGAGALRPDPARRRARPAHPQAPVAHVPHQGKGRRGGPPAARRGAACGALRIGAHLLRDTHGARHAPLALHGAHYPNPKP